MPNVRPTKLSATVMIAEDAAPDGGMRACGITDLDRLQLSLIARVAERPRDPDVRSALSELIGAENLVSGDGDESASGCSADITVDFGQIGNSFTFCKRGWWGPEARNRWSMGGQSEMLIKDLDKSRDHHVTINVVPFLAAPALVRQRITLRINKIVVAHFSVSRVSELELFVPAEVLKLNPVTFFSFSCPDHASPAHLKLNGDTRDIAFLFSRMVVRSIGSSFATET